MSKLSDLHIEQQESGESHSPTEINPMDSGENFSSWELEQERKWKNYYRNVDIPNDWENVSYGNDMFPSFQFNGYHIWFNSPILAIRHENYLDFGYDNLDNFEKDGWDWEFMVTLSEEYGEGKDPILMTSDFDEVMKLVNYARGGRS